MSNHDQSSDPVRNVKKDLLLGECQIAFKGNSCFQLEVEGAD